MRKAIKITKEFLVMNGACQEGLNWFISQKSAALSVIINKLIKEKHFDWANWTVTKFMSHQQNVRYACFSARQALENFEKVFPQDSRPREAIEAALKWADNPTEKNRSAAESAESAARSAALSALSAESAARSAALSAESAARSAALSAESAESAAWKTILIYGVKLILGKVIDKVIS